MEIESNQQTHLILILETTAQLFKTLLLILCALFSLLFLLLFTFTRCRLILITLIVFLCFVTFVYNAIVASHHIHFNTIVIEAISKVEHQVYEILIVSRSHQVIYAGEKAGVRLLNPH